jgi:hypothetical protein
MTHQTPSEFIIEIQWIPNGIIPYGVHWGLLCGLLWLLCGLSPPSPVQAQTTQQAQAPENTTLTALHERVTTFLGALGERTTARRAVEQMVEGGPLEQQTNTTRLIEQVEQFSSRYGLYLESERVASRTVGRDLVVLTYLYKTDQFPVVWRFTFYRPPTPGSSGATWRVVAISFDTNYQLLELSVGEERQLQREP